MGALEAENLRRGSAGEPFNGEISVNSISDYQCADPLWVGICIQLRSHLGNIGQGEIIMRHMTALTAISLFIGLGLVTGPVEAKTVKVKCNHGDTIADALTQGMPGEPLVVNIWGVCNENVTITRNHVTLQGKNPNRSEIRGVPETDPFEESPITLLGAQLVVIDNLTVSGGGSSGIAASASFFTVSNSVIEDNGFHGIAVFAGSVARIDDNMIHGNSRHGISVTAAFAQIINNTIEDNVDGIRVFAGGNALIGETIGGTPGPNTIKTNGTGIAVTGPGRAVIRNNTMIEDNMNHGVLAHLGGSVELTNNTISGNGVYGLFVNEGSSARLGGGNTIVSAEGDFNIGAAVAVYRSSSLRIRGGNTLENTAGRFITNDSSAAGGFALDVEMGSSFRQDGGHTTIIGNVDSFNQSTVDFRNVDITGSVYADGLDGNVRFRDQSQPSANITITDGNVYTVGDPVSIREGLQQPTFDADIDCNGNSVSINSPIFTAGHGFVHCP
jgi:hypothetical protein